jgi:PAS domain S-box-containing protein
MPEAQSDLFRLAVELSPAGMLVIDERGTIVLVNREIERLFGYDRTELVGRSIDLLVPPRFRERHPGFRRSFLGNPQARPMGAGRDLFGLRKDGSEMPVEIGLNPIPTDGGMLVLGSVVDISARRRLEDRLRQAQKMEAIGTLAGGIAHDFNNLLRAIVGYSELVERTLTDAEARADIDQVLRAAQRGQQLVRRIMAFSRQRELRRTPMRLERPVLDAIELLRASLPRTIDLRCHCDADAPAVRADDTQIHQVLMNLVTNAAQALGDAAGVIEVTLTAFSGGPSFREAHQQASGANLFALLTVSDDGPGMTPGVAERAFEPFFTTKPTGAGTGFGLAVVHGIVESYGGVVEIDSRPGEGVRVKVYLPAAELSLQVSEAAAASRPSGPHVLLVEDEEQIAHLSKRQLESHGFRVTFCTSSLQALEEFRARPDAFDVVVTDNTMPKLTGMGLAHEILTIRPGTRILLVSGLAETLDEGVLYAKGIAGVLGKPHTGSELAEAVRQILPNRPAP